MSQTNDLNMRKDQSTYSTFTDFDRVHPFILPLYPPLIINIYHTNAYLYSLEACCLTKSQISSLDFITNRFFIELFNTVNVYSIIYCHNAICFKFKS